MLEFAFDVLPALAKISFKDLFPIFLFFLNSLTFASASTIIRFTFTVPTFILLLLSLVDLCTSSGILDCALSPIVEGNFLKDDSVILFFF